MPYVIRYHNQFKQSAIEEAVMMDRSYSPKIEAIDWMLVVEEFVEFISRIKSPGSDYSASIIFLWLTHFLAEQKPPQMDEIKSKVEHAFQTQGISVYRDLIWSLDYLCTNNNLPR